MSIFFKKSTELISAFKLQPLLQKQYLTIDEVQVRSGNSIGGCLACPPVFFENESRKKCYFCYHYLFTRVLLLNNSTPEGFQI